MVESITQAASVVVPVNKRGDPSKAILYEEIIIMHES